MASETPISAQVEILIEQGEPKAAFKLLEAARKEALSREDIAVLEDVLAGARLVYAHAEGKHRDEAGRIAYAAQQNIRFLTRAKALAEGRDWVLSASARTTTCPEEPRDRSRLERVLSPGIDRLRSS